MNAGASIASYRHCPAPHFNSATQMSDSVSLRIR